MPAGESDPVRRGYDALSYYYRADDAAEGRYAPWLADLKSRLPPAGSALDLGCGCGVPVVRSLAQAGHEVTGVDVSEVQIERARRLVPAGTFVRADATTITFPAETFDAVVCLYALIRMPPAALAAARCHLAAPGRLAARGRRTPGLDRHDRELAGRAGTHVLRLKFVGNIVRGSRGFPRRSSSTRMAGGRRSRS
ncbi:MAG: class I SAM-dependent methyltransferase [Streptosporangiaceae bacterium]